MQETLNTKMTPEQASPILGISPNEIRYALRKGTLPIGRARKATRGKGYRYDIYRNLVMKYVGGEESSHDRFTGPEDAAV